MFNPLDYLVESTLRKKEVDKCLAALSDVKMLQKIKFDNPKAYTFITGITKRRMVDEDYQMSPKQLNWLQILENKYTGK